MNPTEPKPQTPLTNSFETFCLGTGTPELVRKDDARSLELKLQEAERQRDEANEHLDSTNISCDRAEAERDQLIKVVDGYHSMIEDTVLVRNTDNDHNIQSFLTQGLRITETITAYSILPHVQAKKGNQDK